MGDMKTSTASLLMGVTLVCGVGGCLSGKTSIGEVPDQADDDTTTGAGPVDAGDVDSMSSGATSTTAMTMTTMPMSTETDSLGTDGTPDTGDTETETGDTGDTGDTDTGGEKFENCVDPDGASADFTVTVDGEEVNIDYSGFNAPNPVSFFDWDLWDFQPEIDGPCTVTDAQAASVTLACTDVMAIDRSMEITWTTNPSVDSLFVIDETVNLRYVLQHNHDELEHEPTTINHSFVITAADDLRLAGIDGRYSVYSNLGAAWPSDVLDITTQSGLCPPSFESSCDNLENTAVIVTDPEGDFVSVMAANALTLGSHVVIVDHATVMLAVEEDDETGGLGCCCFKPVNERTLRVLVGPPT